VKNCVLWNIIAVEEPNRRSVKQTHLSPVVFDQESKIQMLFILFFKRLFYIEAQDILTTQQFLGDLPAAFVLNPLDFFQIKLV
jgi:hypothetical protein